MIWVYEVIYFPVIQCFILVFIVDLSFLSSLQLSVIIPPCVPRPLASCVSSLYLPVISVSPVMSQCLSPSRSPCPSLSASSFDKGLSCAPISVYPLS